MGMDLGPYPRPILDGRCWFGFSDSYATTFICQLWPAEGGYRFKAEIDWPDVTAPVTGPAPGIGPDILIHVLSCVLARRYLLVVEDFVWAAVAWDELPVNLKFPPPLDKPPLEEQARGDDPRS